MKRLSIYLLLILMIIIMTVSCTTVKAEKERADITKDFIAIMDSDPELKALMEKSIEKGVAVNPDRKTNPVQSLDEFYDYLDWCAVCMPWEMIDVSETYPSIYDQIDQSLIYFYYYLDQPLKELEDRGYYYPTVQYCPAIVEWCIKYASSWGEYLSTPESWNDDYFNAVVESGDFGFSEGWYGDENRWKTFNEFFARHLISPDVRPIAETELVAPADSKPQGIWKIDEKGDIIQPEGVLIKSRQFNRVSDLLGPDSSYGDAFAGGTLTHTFLDVNDYHRYHFPVSGTVVEMNKIPAMDAAGGITVWDEESGRYVLQSQVIGWQAIETRDSIVLDTDYGLVAIIPVGMSQVSSCNFTEGLSVGDKVDKGDELGYFLFGGSDIVMIFQDGVDVNMVVPEDGNGGYSHVLMGEPYAELTKK
ncbi:phosphatidylserine decarboxylase [Spirochaetales bacterium NM-380-WT-3C1]|uniref:Phosphatidylserine decarboxylase n=2 Tax=Bullifex porci TaxID=2606638 RepID=A0A7X2TRN4_9SPIO|nr:phosphatidylserine decarboxylase [Bullifex porci]MSU06305.1 phosphatidylserine decarboxylase [Bullifex porci]